MYMHLSVATEAAASKANCLITLSSKYFCSHLVMSASRARICSSFSLKCSISTHIYHLVGAHHHADRLPLQVVEGVRVREMSGLDWCLGLGRSLERLLLLLLL
ncbi:hypothetical protein EYF80_036608 [Liparis tanakae]|uniref:Uncharacterized protein n=1 Tax=Liparis tanakae TaxID=230148 RepID=A0A4Z2GIJ2_9TELE|nr:hypothetical protein EYF80_036608 [Liparis tanakae]